MCGKAASALAKENSLGWARGDDSLMMHKDYLIHMTLKVFIIKKEILLTTGFVYTCSGITGRMLPKTI